MYTLAGCHIVLVLIQNLNAFIVEGAGSGNPSSFDDQSDPVLVTGVFVETINASNYFDTYSVILQR